MEREIDYQELLRRGLLSVVRDALRIAADGLPGKHYFYLTFRTADPGVELPATLRRRYPDEMTVVLQHQYWNLEVEDEKFRVTLRFDGVPRELAVPFDALVSFADPAARFGLRFDGEAEPDEHSERGPSPATEPEEATDEATSEDEAPTSPGDVVSLDDFRKR